ncbi:MAG: hypothetical protein KFF50_02165, partial [Desulfatitalea sp.]|nr:hypothetical protein [Desulfatitalea sp.]
RLMQRARRRRCRRDPATAMGGGRRGAGDAREPGQGGGWRGTTRGQAERFPVGQGRFRAGDNWGTGEVGE